LVRKGKLVKVLALGAISKKYNLQVHAASKAAKKAIADKGGSLSLLTI
jgi:ribosomal protein L15